ncbi:MAG: folate-binding Fe/S cluster repair protein [Acinetobacter sp.]|nr:MAG: folate-binding Fe/S cluster repair protein [Acinetobacter sp.]
MSSTMLNFTHFQYIGADAEKFLQGQVTVNIAKLDHHTFQATAICDLKGRIHFGLWLRRQSAELIDIVIAQDLADEFAAHVKKFGAFSKATLSLANSIYPTVVDGQASFSEQENQVINLEDWQKIAIENGQAWITKETSHLFQPQELRLHQRSGVDYDKGCYLGQEIVARLWFKAKPKHWLHLVQGQGETPKIAEQLNNDVQIVNSLAIEQGWIALVTAKPDALNKLDISVLDLPESLNGDVARPK